MSQWIRCFVAVAVDAPVLERLGDYQRQLRRHLIAPEFRWTNPDQVHLTLKFLGNVPPAALPELQEALSMVVQGRPKLHLRAADLGFFPDPRRPRICWVGVGGETQPLGELQGLVDVATEPWAPRETRPFHAHLTLARIKQVTREVSKQREQLPETLTHPDLGDWWVDRVELMESRLQPQGSIYTVLQTFPLNP